MSIQTMKKEIMELKRAAALENKQSEDNRIKNMTDEELQEECTRELEKLGFESEAHFYECAKMFILEKNEQVNMSNEYAVHKRIFELFENFKMFEEFMFKYSSLEWSE